MNAILQVLLNALIQLVANLVPVLGGLVTGPFGWLFNIALSWVSRWLYGIINWLITRIEIKEEVAKALLAAQKATQELLQLNSNASEADRAKAIQDFLAAHSALSHLILH